MSRSQPLQVCPGRCLGFLALGASLQQILSIIKSQPQTYSSLDLSYAPSDPLSTPVVIDLPQNGLRLRFDGSTQRLRLIEVLDFSYTPLTYESRDVVKISQDQSKVPGPAFRHIYDRLIGPTFPGEYIAPAEGSASDQGTYVLSYPGVAFTFPVQNSAWLKTKDFVSLLSSQYAGPAKCMAIFDGESWKEARVDLYDRPSPFPRPYNSATRVKTTSLDEVDYVVVTGDGSVEIVRRNASSFRLMLNSCKPQDLLVELGPPDAIYRKSDRRLSIHKAHRKSRSSSSNTRYDEPSDTGYSSHAVSTDDSDEADEDFVAGHQRSSAKAECFWNYFRHGIDVFMSLPQPTPDRLTFSGHDTFTRSAITEPQHLVATKVLLHGNIPGSYPFNRYRRCRWKLGSAGAGERSSKIMTSETPFTRISKTLQKRLDSAGTSEEKRRNFQQGMILNRGWGNSPGSSCELLGGWEGDKPAAASENASSGEIPGAGNTELFGFPGLNFEVLKNGAISCLTIY